jgi:hypothetical protein
MKLWKLLDFVCALLSLPMLGCLGVLTWVGFLGGPGRFAWPTALLLLGTAGLFIALQAISNDMQDKASRERYRR